MEMEEYSPLTAKEESESKIPRILWMTGAVVCVVTLLAGWGVIPTAIKKKIAQSKTLAPESEGRQAWEKLPFPLTFKVYVFNITNVYEVHNNGEKPILEEIGPFVYDEWKEKSGMEDNEANDTVKSHMKNTWYYKKEETESHSLTGDEIVYIPNPALLGMLIKGERDQPALLGTIAKAVPSLFNDPEMVFLKTTIKRLLFDGNYVNCTKKDFLVTAVCGAVKKEATFKEDPSNPGIYLFSFFGNKNATPEAGELVVRRGTKDVQKVGEVVTFNGDHQVKIWETSPCIDIKGTDSSIFPPNLDPSPLWSFSPDVCRSMKADFDRVTKFKGIKVFRFTSNFGDVEGNPEEKCFCIRPETCYKGVIDLYKCAGAPIIASAPHFLDANEKFRKAVGGLHPEEELHGTALEMEPMTGSPLKIRKRLQFSMPIHPIANINMTRGLPDVIVPMFWIEEGIDMYDPVIEQMKKKLFNVLHGIKIGKWTVLTIGAVMALAGIVLTFINPFDRKMLVITPQNNNNNNIFTTGAR